MIDFHCWGYQDTDRKRPPAEKLRHAIEHYRSIHGHDCTHALINGSLVRDIPDPPLTLVEHAIPVHTFLMCVVEAR